MARRPSTRRGSPSTSELLAAAYALDGPDANRELYPRWAGTYERGFIADSGYIYHEQVAAVFAQRCLPDIGPDDAVVDVGCGTGLAGVSLRRHTAAPIDGLDISPEMLDQAARKQVNGAAVYRHLLLADLTTRLPIASHSYGGAISVGTFTHGHVGPAALAEVLRIVRPGGRCAIGVNAAHFAEAKFGDAFSRHASREGRLVDLHTVDVPIYVGSDMADPDRFAHVVTFAVAPAV